MRAVDKMNATKVGCGILERTDFFPPESGAPTSAPLRR